jgi:hypothetical protein
MSDSMEVAALKDASQETPVPTSWRPTLGEIVRAFAGGDFELTQGISTVDRVAPAVAQQAKAYVKEYGESLVDLPEETWTSSVSQWMDGYWDVLVDLWTAESGASDLVLSVRVRESGSGFRFEVCGLYVP